MKIVMATGMALVLSIGLSGCASSDSDENYTPYRANAPLYNAAGQAVGMASLAENSRGMSLTINVDNMPPGPHGVHLHMTGRCDRPDFTSAGTHWNPSGKQHGLKNPSGSHWGDVPNLQVATNGKGSLMFDLPGIWIAKGDNPVLDADGTSIIVHASADDNVSDPSGNSGARIACGVFAASRTDVIGL